MTIDTEGYLKVIDENFKNLSLISGADTIEKLKFNKWSCKEILGHLIDSANVNYIRIINALTKDDLIFDGYPQDDWVKFQNYNNRKWSELVLYWKNINHHLINLVESISPEKLSSETRNHNFNIICLKKINKDSESNLAYLITDYFNHLDHHLNQIYHYKER